MAEANPETWAVGFCDECWWSRVALPTLNSWAEEGEPLRLIQRSLAKDDPEPKAISCYGLYLPQMGDTYVAQIRRRKANQFHNDAVSLVVLREARGGGEEGTAAHLGQSASWHVSKEVRRWLGKHNRRVKESGSEAGVRIVSCLLPKQSPWLNAIEPKWVHAKRKVVEPDGLLGAYELADRVCRLFDCPHHEHFTVPQKVA